MKMNRIIPFILLMLLSVSGAAQDSTAIVSVSPDSTHAKAKVNHFTLGMSLMARGEIRDGGFPADPEAEHPTDRSGIIIGRARLVLGYDRPYIAARVSAQYVGAWGDGSTNAFNLHEAWAKLTSRQGLFLQFGRQALSYDDERIIGPDDWTMAGNKHDALRMGYEGHGHKVHILAAYNQNIGNLDAGTTFFAKGAMPYKTMQTLWYHYDLPVFPFGFSVLAMNIGLQAGEKGKNEHMEWQQLVGSYVTCSPKYCHLEASYYHQFGHVETGLPVTAFMASVKAQIQPSPIYGFTLGYDYLSGDDYIAVLQEGAMGLPQHKVIKGFNPVYGSHHKFYGAMDFFYISSFHHDFSPGLQNAFAGVEVHPVKGLDIAASYHYMAATTDMREHDGSLINKTLGHMAEAEASYRFLKFCSVSAGFTYMGGTQTMQRLKCASSDGRLYWGWLSLIVSPDIVDVKW